MKNIITRQIAIDTETTGINQLGAHYEHHKIIEIGAIEIINRRLTGNNFHIYLKPNRLVDPEAFNIHGIADEFLLDKPTFAEIADQFLKYIQGAEIIMHNASFDIGFIDYEFSKLNRNIPKIDTFCKIIDTLSIAKKIFPGKHNNLDALCSRYAIDNNSRKILHSALLDASILARIYLLMTGYQTSIPFNLENKQINDIKIQRVIRKKTCKFRVLLANSEELTAHESHLDLIQDKNGFCLWRTCENFIMK